MKQFSLFFFSHFPLCAHPTPTNPSLCTEIGCTIRERRDKQTWAPMSKEVEGEKNEFNMCICKHPYMYTHWDIGSNSIYCIYTHIATVMYIWDTRKAYMHTCYLFVHHKNRTMFRHSKQIHIWTHFPFFLSHNTGWFPFFFFLWPTPCKLQWQGCFIMLPQNLNTCKPIRCINGQMLILPFTDDGFHLHQPHDI